MEIAKNRLLEAETKRFGKNDCLDEKSFSESAGKRFSYKRYNCGRVGHKRSECKVKITDASGKPREYAMFNGTRRGRANVNVSCTTI